MIKLAGAGGLAAGLGVLGARGAHVYAAGPLLGLRPEIPGVRVVDTRPGGDAGKLASGTPRDFGPFSALGPDGQAVYGTVTVFDWNAPGWLIVYNQGGQVPGDVGSMLANVSFGGPAPAASGAFLVGDTARPVVNPTGQAFTILIRPLREHGPALTCHVVVDVFGVFVPLAA